LLLNGFLVNELGTLSWHGTADLWRAAGLTGAAAVGRLAPVIRHEPNQLSRQEIRRLHGWLDREAVALTTRSDKEESLRGRPDVRTADDRGIRGPRPDGAGGGKAVNAENLVGLILAVALTAFLVTALLFPERF
jgi:K+-transporting ATPase KdpF subunit